MVRSGVHGVGGSQCRLLDTPVAGGVYHDMMFHECDVGHGMRPGGEYSFVVYIEDRSRLEGTIHMLNFTVAQSPSNSILGEVSLVPGFNATYLSVSFTPVLQGTAWGVVVPREMVSLEHLILFF